MMASTIQMFLALLALAINTTIILMLYFVSNVVLAPLVHALEQIVPAGSQVISLANVTFFLPALWAILLGMEIIIIIACVVVMGRSSVVEDE